MITAGIHGTEIAGVLAAHELRQVKIKKGTLIIVPIVNKMAYKKRIRGNPDLNRTFPRTSIHTVRHPLANKLFQLAQKHHPNWCLDLHEATGFSNINKLQLGQSLICYPDSDSIKIAERVINRMNCSIKLPQRHFTIRNGILPGSFRTSTAHFLHSHSVTVETSMNLPLFIRKQHHIQIVNYFLHEIGIME